MKKQTRKDFLINQMLEAKRIELENKKKSLLNRLKNIFSKPKRTKEQKISSLKKFLEKKDAKELEYMILEKEESILSLKKKIKDVKQEQKLNRITKLLYEMKKKEGKRTKIGREIGLERKEVTELEKELKEREKRIKRKERRIEEKEGEVEGAEEELEEKPKKVKIKKIAVKGKKKRKGREKGKKAAGKRKKGKRKKISFTSPMGELRKKIEKGIGKKKKKAVEEFHKEFTSGKEKTLVSIKGNTQIIAGKGRETPSAMPKMSRTQTVQMQKKREKEIDFELTKTKEKIKNLKSAFFHRQINEEDYKKKMFDYQEELKSLEMEKKRPKAVTPETAIKPEGKEEVKEIESTRGLKTVQDEIRETAVRHTAESKARIQQALKAFDQEFTTEPYFGQAIKPKGVFKIETPEELEPVKPTGIIKRIAPKISQKKAMEMETKLFRIMKKNQIDETQVRREFEFVSPQQLMKRFDRILDAIERKYAPKTEVIKDQTIKAKPTVTEKKKEKKEGKLKDIQEKKIVTDFDRLLQLVKEKGKINEKEASKALKLNPERIKECYVVLEKNDLVKVDFPVFGGAQIISKDYIKPKKEKKKKGVK